MPDINPLTNNQIFLKKIAENTGSDYDTGDVSEINPLTIDQIFLKEIAANTAGQAGDITELEGKVADNTSAIEATQDMISDAYDSTHTYNVGDYCIHENTLYKCKTTSTTGTWDSSKWDTMTVAEELGDLTDAVNRGSVSVSVSTSDTYSQKLTELYGLIDWSKMSIYSKISILGEILSVRYLMNGSVFFIGGNANTATTANTCQVDLTANTKKYAVYTYSTGVIQDITYDTAWSDGAITIYY